MNPNFPKHVKSVKFYQFLHVWCWMLVADEEHSPAAWERLRTGIGIIYSYTRDKIDYKEGRWLFSVCRVSAELGVYSPCSEVNGTYTATNVLQRCQSFRFIYLGSPLARFNIKIIGFLTTQNIAHIAVFRSTVKRLQNSSECLPDYDWMKRQREKTKPFRSRK